jgi:hypothetical protein
MRGSANDWRSLPPLIRPSATSSRKNGEKGRASSFSPHPPLPRTHEAKRDAIRDPGRCVCSGCRRPNGMIPLGGGNEISHAQFGIVFMPVHFGRDGSSFVEAREATGFAGTGEAAALTKDVRPAHSPPRKQWQSVKESKRGKVGEM